MQGFPSGVRVAGIIGPRPTLPPHREPVAALTASDCHFAWQRSKKAGRRHAVRAKSRPRPLLPQGEGVGRSPTDEGLVGADCCLEPASATPAKACHPSPSGGRRPNGPD